MSVCLAVASASLAAGISQSRNRTYCLSCRRVAIVTLSASLRCFWESIPHTNWAVWVPAVHRTQLPFVSVPLSWHPQVIIAGSDQSLTPAHLQLCFLDWFPVPPIHQSLAQESSGEIKIQCDLDSVSPQGPVNCVAFSRTGEYFSSGGSDEQVIS